MNKRLPEGLLQAIERELAPFSHLELMKASEKLSNRYRHRPDYQGKPFIITDADRCAYLAARLPATYAVIHRVLLEIFNRVPGLNIQSLLDIGAGPGTVMWSAVEIFSTLSSITLIEQDAQWVALGKRLAAYSEHPAIKNASWLSEKVRKESLFEPHDLVVLSYMIGELPEEEIPSVISRTWQAASQIVAFIEPGTPDGFKKILIARDTLIELGAHLVAPCPHALECPMAKKGDWCHFSERLERSDLHREIKDVSLGYEDEKYSYVVGSKKATIHPKGRILRHPQKRSGHLSFTLCTAEGLKQKIISRREGETYKQARKLNWGDCLDP